MASTKRLHDLHPRAFANTASPDALNTTIRDRLTPLLMAARTYCLSLLQDLARSRAATVNRLSRWCGLEDPELLALAALLIARPQRWNMFCAADCTPRKGASSVFTSRRRSAVTRARAGVVVGGQSFSTSVAVGGQSFSTSVAVGGRSLRTGVAVSMHQEYVAPRNVMRTASLCGGRGDRMSELATVDFVDRSPGRIDGSDRIAPNLDRRGRVSRAGADSCPDCSCRRTAARSSREAAMDARAAPLH